MEVDFITLGDASERLNVPSPTLRNWTDQLEEFEVHYVKRNNRNERVYYDSDLNIFKYVRDLKQEYGRKTTMRDIANLLVANKEEFELRTAEDAPSPVLEPSNKTGEPINNEIMNRMMENQQIRTFVTYLVAETTKQSDYQWMEKLEILQGQWNKEREELRNVLREEIKKEIAVGQEQIVSELHTIKEEQKIRDEEQRKQDQEEKERIAKRDAELMKSLKALAEKKEKENEQPKGFLSKLFGK